MSAPPAIQLTGATGAEGAALSLRDMTYTGPSQINVKELPINPAAAAAIDPAIVSDTVWSASPAGLTPSPPDFLDGVDGTLHGWTDATVADRIAAADAG